MFTWFFILLAIWGIYKRVRRLFGKQLIKRGWIWFRLLLILFTAIMIFPRMVSSGSIIFFLMGMILALVLVYLSIRFMVFSAEGKNVYYRTNPYIGATVMLLVLFRLIYKLPIILTLTNWLSHPEGRTLDLSTLRAVMDPISSMIVTMMLTYFSCSNLYMLLASRRASLKLYANDSSSQE